MSRLTYKDASDKWVVNSLGLYMPKCGLPTHLSGEVVERLANYEDAEESKMLIKLPCKVGDKVYWFWCDSEGNVDSELFEDTILYFYFDKDGIGIAIDYYDGHIGHYVKDGDIVNSVRKIYLNKESALADLK